MSFYNQIFGLFCLIVAGAFFSFSEISLAASRKLRLQQMADEGDSRADQVLKTKANPGKFFSVIQIGINMVSILGGIVGEAAFSPYFEDIYKLFLSQSSAETAGFLTSFFLVTLAFVVMADLLPKRFSINNPERYAMLCATPMRLLGMLFAPLVWMLEALSNAALKAAGVPLIPLDKITSDDILASVDAGADAGVIDPSEQAVIENVFNLENRPVTTAMTPRESIVYFMLDDPEAEVRKTISESPHNFFLVCDNDLDHVIGYIESKDILRRVLAGKSIAFKDEGLIKPAFFVPDTLTLSEILEMFQRSRGEFAVVLNEYALVVGLLTLSDVTCAVMGELVLTPEESQIIARDETSWLVDGATPTVDLMHTLEIDELPEETSYETVAGFMMYMLRKIPKRTDSIDWSGFRFEVIDVDQNKIDQILVTKLNPQGNTPAEEAEKLADDRQ